MLREPKVSELAKIGRHGIDCPKVEHNGNGYLHEADNDSPYARSWLD